MSNLKHGLSGPNRTPMYNLWLTHRYLGHTKLEWEAFHLRYQHNQSKECLWFDGKELQVVDRGDEKRMRASLNRNTSGFIGVFLDKRRGTYHWEMRLKDRRVTKSNAQWTAEECAIDRDNYIIQNSISARLNFTE